ncbi:MAG: O-antigen ligase family protein [Prevotella sp.]|nr:O-antigen ligase family protein [Prevotella sp.]
MIIRIVFLLTILASLISQLPIVLDSGYDVYLKATWFIPFLYLGVFNFKSYFERPLWFMYAGTFCMIVYCSICEAVTGISYLNVDVYNMTLSLMIGITSYSLLRNYYTPSLLLCIAIISMVGSIILCVYLYELYFIDYDLADRLYAYKAKNSMGQILFNSSILIALYPNVRNTILKILQISSIGIIFIMLCMLKSRATLIGVLFTISYMIIQSKNLKVRWFTIVLCSLIVIYILRNDAAYDTIVNGIMFAGRDAQDVNELSSDRVYTISQALNVIPQNLWVGIGNKYIDSMPIAMVLQFGVCGAMIVFLYIGALFNKVRSLDRNIKIHISTYLLLIAMMLNSLFEAQPPFGPGIKCFILWMAIGFSFAYEKNIRYSVRGTTSNIRETF